MGKDVTFKNHDRFVQIGLAIAALRKMRGLSQEKSTLYLKPVPYIRNAGNIGRMAGLSAFAEM